jgi:CRP-like cAMP-binding protein
MKNSTHPVVSTKAQAKTAKARAKIMDVAHPPFCRYVFSLFSQRLEDVAFQSLIQRIAALLLHADGGCLNTTYQALAGQIGASREAVSRTLKKLEAAACIKLTRDRIGISNRRKLSGWQ